MASGDKIYIADKPTLDSVNTKIGNTTDDGSKLSLFGFLAWIKAKFTTDWTSARAAKLDNLDGKISDIGGGGGKAVFLESGTFTVPSGVAEIYITACASGGKAVKSGLCGGGGGACIVHKKYTVTPGSLIDVTVGVGINTIIGSLVTLSKGGNAAASSVGVAGGAGATDGVVGNANSGIAGPGGASFYGQRPLQGGSYQRGGIYLGGYLGLSVFGTGGTADYNTPETDEIFLGGTGIVIIEW